MEKRDAWLAFMRATIRAQDSRHMLTWSVDDLLQSYIVASIPGISFHEFCKQMEWAIEEPEPATPEPEDSSVNDLGIQQFMSAQKAGHPVKVESKPAEPVEDK